MRSEIVAIIGFSAVWLSVVVAPTFGWSLIMWRSTPFLSFDGFDPGAKHGVLEVAGLLESVGILSEADPIIGAVPLDMAKSEAEGTLLRLSDVVNSSLDAIDRQKLWQVMGELDEAAGVANFDAFFIMGNG